MGLYHRGKYWWMNYMSDATGGKRIHLSLKTNNKRVCPTCLTGIRANPLVGQRLGRLQPSTVQEGPNPRLTANFVKLKPFKPLDRWDTPNFSDKAFRKRTMATWSPKRKNCCS